MKAVLLVRSREVYSDGRFAEIVIWRLPRVLAGSAHALKYRLAFIVESVCVLRYDNEAGKGDHRHYSDAQESYDFTTVEALLADFDADIRRYLDEYSGDR